MRFLILNGEKTVVEFQLQNSLMAHDWAGMVTACVLRPAVWVRVGCMGRFEQGVLIAQGGC